MTAHAERQLNHLTRSTCTEKNQKYTTSTFLFSNNTLIGWRGAELHVEPIHSDWYEARESARTRHEARRC